MITLIPTSGLANRMRAIDSAVALCDKYNAKLNVIWARDSLLNCPFVRLFKPIDFKDMKIHDLPALPYKYRIIYNKNHLLNNFFSRSYDIIILQKEFKKLFEDKFNFDNLVNYNRVLLASHSRFYPNPLMFKLFNPIDELMRKIEERTRCFSTNTVGVHIRRTDNKNSALYSPIKLFIKAMREEIEMNPDTNFYLASDAIEVKQELENEFKSRVITIYQDTGRDSTKGIQEALIDLYSLSRTRLILGSYYSSFSETAAQISGIKAKIIKEHI